MNQTLGLEEAQGIADQVNLEMGQAGLARQMAGGTTNQALDRTRPITRIWRSASRRQTKSLTSAGTANPSGRTGRESTSSYGLKS
jgi:hypothetical protein